MNIKGWIFCLILGSLTWYSFRFTTEQISETSLGEKLFFDPILSSDQTISCATCHNPKFAFADSLAISPGVKGRLGTRNTPSVMNMLARPYFFYDGRAVSLEAQIFHPIQNPLEMDLSTKEVELRLRKNKFYKQWFLQVYNSLPDSSLISRAIAAYIRTLESPGDAPNDLWIMEIDTQAMSLSQQRGRALFMEKGKCFDCHFSPDFTGDEFRNIGLFDGKKLNDAGRYDFTKDSTDIGKFKVPSLRNVAVTAPYMHNGMFQTLEQVMDYYDNPNQFVEHSINTDSLLQKPLQLSLQEKADIIAFLHALTDKQYLQNSSRR